MNISIVWGDLADTSDTTEALVLAVAEHADRCFHCMSSAPRRLHQAGPVVSRLRLHNTQLVSRQGTRRPDMCMSLKEHDYLVFSPFQVTWTTHFLQRDMCILSGSEDLPERSCDDCSMFCHIPTVWRTELDWTKKMLRWQHLPETDLKRSGQYILQPVLVVLPSYFSFISSIHSCIQHCNLVLHWLIISIIRAGLRKQSVSTQELGFH